VSLVLSGMFCSVAASVSVLLRNNKIYIFFMSYQYFFKRVMKYV
jgi:hypothetical protein